MFLSQNSEWVFLIGLGLTSAASALWVYRDSRARLIPGFTKGSDPLVKGRRRSEPWLWAFGTLALLAFVLPFYLLVARPAGALVRCPSCGEATLSHRAVCGHCERPILFDSPPAAWGLGEMIGISFVFGFTLPFVASAFGIGGSPSLAAFSAYTVIQSALLLVLSLHVVTRRYHRTPEVLGLTGDRAAVMAGAGVLLGAAMVFVSAQIEAVAVALVGAVVGPEEARRMAEAEHMSNPVTEVLRSGVTTAELVWILVLLCVVVPVAEEIFFRGVVYRGLRARWGALVAVLASSVFFGAVHLELVHFLPILVLGMILAYSLERTGSLVPAMAIHALNNVVAVFGTLYRWDI